MAFALDVTLPKGEQAEFPPRCVRCLEQPDGAVKFAGRAFSWWDLLWAWMFLFQKPVKVEVPVCRACRARVRWRRWLDRLVYLVVTVVVIWLVYPYLRQLDLGRQWSKLAALAAVLVALLPWLVIAVLFPPAFDLTVHKEDVDYEFANARYAADFYLANEQASCNEPEVHALLDDEAWEPDDEHG